MTTRKGTALRKTIRIDDKQLSERIIACLPFRVPETVPIRDQALRAYAFIVLLPLDEFEPLDQLLARNMRETCHTLAEADIDVSFHHIDGKPISRQSLSRIENAYKALSPVAFDTVRDDAKNQTLLRFTSGLVYNASIALFEWRMRLLAAARKLMDEHECGSDGNERFGPGTYIFERYVDDEAPEFASCDFVDDDEYTGSKPALTQSRSTGMSLRPRNARRQMSGVSST